MSVKVNPPHRRVSWIATDHVFNELRELRRDFMQPLTDGRELFALRINGADTKFVSRLQLEVSGFGHPLPHPLMFYGNEHASAIYGLFFNRDDPAKDSEFINEYFLHPAYNVLSYLSESQHPCVNRNNNTWRLGREWLPSGPA
jgi:hypothetical protein